MKVAAISCANVSAELLDSSVFIFRLTIGGAIIVRGTCKKFIITQEKTFPKHLRNKEREKKKEFKRIRWPKQRRRNSIVLAPLCDPGRWSMAKQRRTIPASVPKSSLARANSFVVASIDNNRGRFRAEYLRYHVRPRGISERKKPLERDDIVPADS